MIIVNDWKPLTIITKSSILDVAVVLDPPLQFLRGVKWKEDGVKPITLTFFMIKRLSHKNYIVWRRGINPGSPELKNSSKHNRQMLFAISNNFKKTIRSITK